MCLAIPAKVVRVEGPMATVSIGGVIRQASVHLLDDVREGEYLLIHAGFALSKIDEEAARETLRLLEQMGDLDPGLTS